jgi:hypothetical protein
MSISRPLTRLLIVRDDLHKFSKRQGAFGSKNLSKEKKVMDSTLTYTATTERSHGRGTVWTGRIISGLVVAFLLFDSITKIMQNPYVLKASAKFGYPVSAIPIVGIILFACIVVYVIPRTSTLGAALLTGYLGGAVDANLRAGTPLFSNLLFPVYFGILVWAGLYLRNRRVRQFFSLRKPN